MVLLPFGLLDRTKAIIDKILNYFFVSAIRIAIFLFLVLIINPTVKNAFKNAKFMESVMGIDTWAALISLFALTFLVFKTPSFAAALFNGAINSPPSLTGIGVQAVQTAIMLKTLGASKAAAATKKSGEKVVEEGVENSVKAGSQSGSAAIDTSRKDVITDSSTDSSNKKGSNNQNNTTQTENNSTGDTSTQTDTVSTNTDNTKKDTVTDSGNIHDTSSKDENTSINSTTESNSSPQIVDNYYDTSDGSTKDDDYSSSTPNNNINSTNQDMVNDRIQAERQSIEQQDSSQSTQKTIDHAKDTINEFKKLELKSQEEKE